MIRPLVIPLLLVTAVAFIALVIWLKGDPNRPRFVPVRSQAVSGPLKSLSYEFLTPRPFEGGKIWISVMSGNDYHVYLFDIEERAILGELVRGKPAFMNGDQTKAVCSQRTLADRSLRGKVLALLARISGGRIRPPQLDDAETFWIVDLKRNSTLLLGSVAQSKGAGSTLFPSPGFDRGFINPTGNPGKPGFYVCDVAHEAFTEVQLDGWPAGWWDDKSILFKTTNNDFVLYDVVQQTTSPFLSQTQIAKAFTEAEVADDPTKAGAFFVWNVRENDVYVTDTHKRWQAVESYLFKVQRPNGGLKLVSPKFKFEWSDHFNAAETLYVYTGRESGQSNSAVFLRDLKTDTVVTLVPDDGGNMFSIPQFYRDGVIFVRSNALWRVDLTGSNVTRLFPPEASAEKRQRTASGVRPVHRRFLLIPALSEDPKMGRVTPCAPRFTTQ